MDTPIDYIDSYLFACSYLTELDPEKNYMHLRPTNGPIPPAPRGYVLQKEDLIFESPFFGMAANVPFAYFSSDRVFLCESIVRPDLLKPEIIKTLWLHLHIACLIAAGTRLTPDALLSCRVQPCIIGLKPLPHECFPLAFSAIRRVLQCRADVENLPF